MSSGKFWETMNLLIGKEYRRTGKEVMEDVQDWVEKVVVKKDFSVEESETNVRPHSKIKKSDFNSSGYFSESRDEDKEVEDFIKSVDLPKIDCKFSHPHVTSRLEKLMGSNLVCLTDRDYMQKLQERILEDYGESMDKRIKVRENEEMERVKNLVLSGRIPLHDAPESMADHPIMMIERHCKRLIAQRRAKIKIPKVHIPTHLYSDDTPDPPSGLSIENGHVFRKPYEKLCNPVSRFLPAEEYPFYADNLEEDSDEEQEEEEGEEEGEGDVDHQAIINAVGAAGAEEGGEEEEEEVVDEFMFRRSEYDRLKYESPLIKQLRRCQTVAELYALSDEIIGILKTLDVDNQPVRVVTSEDTLFSVQPQGEEIRRDHRASSGTAGSQQSSRGSSAG